MLLPYTDGMERLEDYIMLVASRKDKLMTQEIKPASIEDYTDPDVLILQDEGQARMSILVAEALYLMSQDIHEEDDRALPIALPVTGEEAIVLKKAMGGLTPAAKVLGCNRITLWRAIKGAANGSAVLSGSQD